MRKKECIVYTLVGVSWGIHAKPVRKLEVCFVGLSLEASGKEKRGWQAQFIPISNTSGYFPAAPKLSYILSTPCFATLTFLTPFLLVSLLQRYSNPCLFYFFSFLYSPFFFSIRCSARTRVKSEQEIPS